MCFRALERFKFLLLFLYFVYPGEWHSYMFGDETGGGANLGSVLRTQRYVRVHGYVHACAGVHVRVCACVWVCVCVHAHVRVDRFPPAFLFS